MEIKKRIYVNGDSFTAGVALADKDLLPFYKNPLPLNYDRNSLDREKYASEKNNFLMNNFISYNQMIDLEEKPNEYHIIDKYKPGYVGLKSHIDYIEKIYAWPSKLEKMLPNTKIINKAIGGQSLGAMLNQTTFDLINYKKTNTKIDHVVLQLVPYTRTEFYRLEHLNHISCIGNIPKDKENYYYRFAKDFYTLQHLQALFIKGLHTISSINETVKSLTGKYPLWIDSCNKKSNLVDYEYLLNSLVTNDFDIEYLKKLYDNSKFDLIDSMTMEKKIYQVDLPFENCGHYTEEVQKLVAEEIKCLLSNLTNNQ